MRSPLPSLSLLALLASSASAQVADFPFFDSFEDPILGSVWAAGGSPDFEVDVTGAFPAYAGSQQLELTTQAASDLQQVFVDLTIDLANQKGIRLHFAHRRTVGGSFFDSGVLLSDDGVDFVLVQSLETLETSEQYEFYSLDLDQLAADNGLTFNNHFTIRFQWKGWGSTSLSPGALIDDVRVVPTNFTLLESLSSDDPIGLGDFGASLVSVADLDGDGVRDLAVGHPGYSLKRGRIEFFSGQTGAYLWSWSKGIFGERLGESLANLGDLDGDGFDELVAGAPSNDVGFADAGAAYVFGSESGSLLAELHGTSPGEAFGSTLGTVPDLDGDGAPEFLIAAPFAYTGPEPAGRVNLFSSIDFSSQVAFDGNQAGAQFGSSLGSIGDLDGDGLAEVLIGAEGFDVGPLGSDEGAVFIYSTAQLTPLFSFTGPATGALFGRSVQGLEDLDLDGLPDFAVGLPGYLGGRGAMQVLSTTSGVVLHQLLGTVDTDRLGATLASMGQVDGFGGADLAVGTEGGGSGYVRMVGLPSFADIGLVDVVDLGTGFGRSITSLGDVNADGLDDIALGAPFEVVAGQQDSGVVRIVTLAKGPSVLLVEGVHSTLAGELVLHGVNLLAGTKVLLDGHAVPGVQVSVSELRVPVGIEVPGGFKSLEVSSPLGSKVFPGGAARYPALECAPILALGADLEVRLANGEAGAYVLAFSNQTYATPAPFESFGWYYGLELNGVWIVASGLFTAESTTRKLVLPGTSAGFLLGTDYYLQAWTSQAVLGLAGFSNTVQTTLVP